MNVQTYGGMRCGIAIAVNVMSQNDSEFIKVEKIEFQE